MKYMIIAVMLFCCSAVFAQDAKVIPLSDADAQIAKAKYEALQKAQKEWDAFKEKVKKDYLTVPEGDSDAGNVAVSDQGFWTNGTTTTITGQLFDDNHRLNCGDDGCSITEKDNTGKLTEKKPAWRYYRQGFEGEFLFSKDFKFVVPKPNSSPTNCISTWLNGCATFTPTPAIMLDSVK